MKFGRKNTMLLLNDGAVKYFFCLANTLQFSSAEDTGNRMGLKWLLTILAEKMYSLGMVIT